jgi:DNA modification methylase
MTEVHLLQGDCLDILPTLADKSVDAVITDPPYAEIDRDYGRLTEAEWWDLMMGVCREVRRILKPAGSAVFILQPNSRKVGSMRGWLFEFQAWVCREWNMVQDFYWWNTTALPTVHTHRNRGLARPSSKPCVWAGSPDCYRNQDEVLLVNTDVTRAANLEARVLNYRPSGYSMRDGRLYATAIERGGATPFNVLPIGNGSAQIESAGHGAGTPIDLAKWWTRYICPVGGVVLDPFVGSGTMAIAAMEYRNGFIGIEKEPKYFAIAERRITAAQLQMVMPL